MLVSEMLLLTTLYMHRQSGKLIGLKIFWFLVWLLSKTDGLLDFTIVALKLWTLMMADEWTMVGFGWVGFCFAGV